MHDGDVNGGGALPWEKNYDEAEVLERAMHAFWARGFEATSMSDLVDATGINRGSIYAAFDGKRALFMRALRHYDKTHRADFLARIARDHAPKDAIIATFEAAAKNTGRQGAPGGCLIVNTALELSPHDPEIRDLVDASLHEVEEFFFDMIEAAQREGTVESEVAARETAQALLGLFLGLRVLTRSKPHRSAIDAITSRARAMLD
jgi:TetR/AcrR family transcriptional repressor of nem operon